MCTVSYTHLDVYKRQAAKSIAEHGNADSRVGIIGTKVTIASRAYEECISRYNGSINIFETSCPCLLYTSRCV